MDGAQQTPARFLRHTKESADVDADSNVQTHSYETTAIAFGETRNGPYAERFTDPNFWRVTFPPKDWIVPEGV